jgi:hypothetical protein
MLAQTFNDSESLMYSPLLRGAAIAATILAATAGTASAKKRPGDPAPAPTPAPPALDCFSDPAIVALSTPDVGVNYAGDAGCVGVRSAGSTLRLAFVVLNPGWTYEVLSNGEGTNSRVQLQFTQTATGRRIDFRYEFGKTVIG